MNLICKIFGHKLPSEFISYLDVKRYAVDGIAREHATVHGECARCGTKFWAGLIHLIQRECDKEALAAVPPALTVELRSYPESNGKRNWTALLVRKEPFNGLIGNGGGITIARGELWNRVAYEAEQTRFLLGERDTEPFILDYGDDVHTPDGWPGEVRGQERADLALYRQLERTRNESQNPTHG